MKDKRKLGFRRFLWFLFFVICIVLTVVILLKMSDREDENTYISLFSIIVIVFDIVTFAFFIGSLTLNCKVYTYNGKEIIVYAGWSNHYIKVDGEIMDEYRAFIFLTPIELSCYLSDGTALYTTISLTNRIKLKINGNLYRQ